MQGNNLVQVILTGRLNSVNIFIITSEYQTGKFFETRQTEQKRLVAVRMPPPEPKTRKKDGFF